MSAERKPIILEKLATQNYFVQLPERIAQDESAITEFSNTGLKFIQTADLNLKIADSLLQERGNWPPVEPDMDLLESGDSEENKRVTIEVSKRKPLIKAALEEEDSPTSEFSQLNNVTDIPIMDTRTPDDQRDVKSRFADYLKNIPLVITQQWEWINKIASERGGVIVAGESPIKADPITFRILRPSIPTVNGTEELGELPSHIKKQKFRLLRSITKDLLKETSIAEEQEQLGIDRAEFEWTSNPLITSVRSIAAETIKSHAQLLANQGVSEFDLAAQVMMHAGSFEIDQLWIGEPEIIQRITELVQVNKGGEANALFEEAFSLGKIQLDMNIIAAECSRQAQNLSDHYQNLTIDMDGKVIKLPSVEMGPDNNPFTDVEHPEADARKKIITQDPTTGESVMTVLERYSGKKITFKSIPTEISMLYSRGFSNLHYAREGELAAYGAFLEGQDLPFAYSSYSSVSRGYTKDMLRHLNVDPTTIIESTRAWNASWAPENTMSLLFTYSHDMLKEIRDREIADGVADFPLEGVITSINPNLGFKAVSFRGIRFNPAGIKPTEFTYLRTGDHADFMPKNIIKGVLGIDSDDELEKNPRFMTNRIPFLPTIEILALFDHNKEQELLKKPIYRISDTRMKKG